MGGTDKQRQIDKLATHQPHVAIGTPGRILDMMNEQALKVHTAEYFVVDEADMTLDMGFLAEVDQIAGRLPKHLQMLVFSATIPEKLRPFLLKYMENPVIEEIKSKAVISDTIENWLISTKGQDKNRLIYQLLTIGHPYLAIVFANTKQHVDEIEELTLKGFLMLLTQRFPKIWISLFIVWAEQVGTACLARRLLCMVQAMRTMLI